MLTIVSKFAKARNSLARVYVCFAAPEDKREKSVKQDEVVERGTAYNTIVRPGTADGNSFPLPCIECHSIAHPN